MWSYANTMKIRFGASVFETIWMDVAGRRCAAAKSIGVV